MKIVLMGAPGCGKGTQALFVSENYNVCHLSMGRLLRDAVEFKTPSGLRAKAAVDAGDLVPDDIVFDLLKEGMKKPECKNGYVIEGMPRTLAQAQKMEVAGIEVDKVINFDVPDGAIIARTGGRWIHRPSGRRYHSRFNPPKRDGFDDVTGEPLIQRADDSRGIAAKRLEIFHKEAPPIKDFYTNKGIFESVTGSLPIKVIRKKVASLLDPLSKKYALVNLIMTTPQLIKA